MLHGLYVWIGDEIGKIVVAHRDSDNPIADPNMHLVMKLNSFQIYNTRKLIMMHSKTYLISIVLLSVFQLIFAV